MNVIVTGVSKGLGLEVARTLLNQGYNVYGISRSKTDALEQLLNEFPQSIHWVSFDLSDAESIRDIVFKQFIGLKTPIHGLVNNAAIAYDDIATNADLNALEAMYKVNVYSPIILSKYAIRQMLLHNIAGSLVHLSSISVHTGYKGLSMYASTKGALEAYSKNISREWGSKGIRSNCVVAGFMETEMSSALTDEQKAKIYRRTSLKKEVSIQSVADTIDFLLSDKSESITGQNIFIDNGTI
ncbi:MAG: SDR family oxidoreductase [Balneolaceae bacterium]|nr:SDR family oxidoreductase [Balneolaceae bacterium]